MAEDKVALVTGANKGIGLETARGLTRLGYRVWLGCRDQAKGEAAAASLRTEGGDVRVLVLDVASAGSIAAAAGAFEAAESKLDALINNAGVLAQDGDSGVVSDAVLRQVFETNLFGALAVISAFLPLLRRSPAGRIVNAASRVGSMSWMGRHTEAGGVTGVAYPASKAALNMATVQLAKALADTPIKVNSGNPGWCATDMTGHAAPRSAAQGAAIMVRLATLPADGPSGGFFEDAGPVPW
jgi:NAD(P)-dependent dehydrogenase (short-subunit alcohol dehydrogenase family)